jgi:hypothetical protein
VVVGPVSPIAKKVFENQTPDPDGAPALQKSINLKGFFNSLAKLTHFNKRILLWQAQKI